MKSVITYFLLIILLFWGTSANLYSQDVEDTLVDNKVELRIPPKDKLEEYQKDKNFQYENSKQIEYPSWILNFLNWLDRLFGRTLSQVFTRNFFIAAFVILLTILIVAIVLRMQGVNIRNILGRRKLDLQTVEFTSEDVNKMNFDVLIADALRAGNYRLAIRFLYLKNLKALSDNLIIEWNPNKTNYSYRYEIKDNSLQKKFLESTYIFDFVWYGEFTLNLQEFEEISTRFREFNQMIQQ